MAISASGVGSGIDINSIVSQLMAIERKPLERLGSDLKQLQSSISAFGKVAGAISDFQTSLRDLSRPDRWMVYKATTASTAFEVAAGSAATEGDYSIRVDKVAQALRVANTPVADANAIVGTGSLTITLGSIDPTTNVFTAKAGTTPANVTITSGSLSGIRDAINAANAGVTASIVNTGSGSRLVVTSASTGYEQAFRIDVADADSTNTDTSGLSSLAFDPAGVNGAGRNLALLQRAQDAEVTINEIPVRSPSNNLSDTVTGLSIKLKTTTAAAETFSVSRDTEAIEKSVNAFITKYNDLQKLLVAQTKVVEGTTTQSPLQGDSAALSVLRQLRNAVSGIFEGQAGDFTRLSEVGVSVQRDGSLQLDTSKWRSANADLGKLSRLFSAEGSPGVANSTGLAKRLADITDSWIGTDGLITSRTDGLNRSVTLNQRAQTDMQSKLSRREQRLLAQYQAMDAQVAKLQSLGNYVGQQITALNRQTSNNS
jgi:flagellar hook-associated protein 2